jgi:hypothetical protein
LFHSDGRIDKQTERQTGGRTGMTKHVVAFRKFAYAPQGCCLFGPCTVHHQSSLYKCCAKANMIYSRSMKRLNGFLAGLGEFGEN